LEEVGLVIEIRDGHARVKMDRKAACETCGRCGMAALSKGSEIIVDAVNRVGARTGDRVILLMESKAVLSAAFFVFIMPLLVGAAGYALGGVPGAIVFFAMSYGLLKLYDKKVEASRKLEPTIVTVVEQE
jgi:sigma-E factor negative regulatory protein RseC